MESNGATMLSDSPQAVPQRHPLLVPPQFGACTPRMITAHRKVLLPELDTRQSQSRLLSQIEELVAADRRKDEATALLLHELRSPLASIQNAIGVLRIRSNDRSL